MSRMERLFGTLSRRLRRPAPGSGCETPTGLSERGRFKEFPGNQNGAIAAITAVSLVVMLGFGAFAIDMSYAYSTRNMLQVTASTAALVGRMVITLSACAPASAGVASR